MNSWSRVQIPYRAVQEKQGIAFEARRSRARPSTLGPVGLSPAGASAVGWVVASSFSDSAFRNREEEAAMSTERYPRKAVIGSPDGGLTPNLKAKSRGFAPASKDSASASQSLLVRTEQSFTATGSSRRRAPPG
jgi:hypothetical protein